MMKLIFIKDLLLSFLSAVLLIVAFPQTNFWILAWVGLIPLLFAIDGKSARESFFWAYLSGFVFFVGTLYWFIHVTWIGAFFLIAYLSLYFGVFGWGYWWLARVSRPVLKNISLAAFWVCLEFIRGQLFTGFDWASLSHSQSQNLWMIQVADITGVYGISFLIVFVNCILKDILVSRYDFRRLSFSSFVFCAVLLAAVGFYGWKKISAFRNFQGSSWRIAVVQANIEQDLKSSEDEWPDNFDRHLRLTLEAAQQKPDLIIWPETSLPGYMWETDLFIKEIQDVARKIGIPVLLGAVTEQNGKYFNSAMLISVDGTIIGEYNKIHLVPFGEYVPFKGWIPKKLANRIPFEDFSSGKEYKVFSLNIRGETLKFSTLICFEDALARLTRRFTSVGAGLLVNMTNDGWFQDTKEPFLHLQSAVFRAIENRRTLVRASNTGVSCAIDPSGKITDFIQDHRGKKTFIEGWNIFTIHSCSQKTFYMMFGDIFSYACFAFLAGVFMVFGRRKSA